MSEADEDPRHWSENLLRAPAGKSCVTCGHKAPKDLKPGEFSPVRWVGLELPKNDDKGFPMCQLCCSAVASIFDKAREREPFLFTRAEHEAVVKMKVEQMQSDLESANIERDNAINKLEQVKDELRDVRAELGEAQQRAIDAEEERSE